MLTITSNASTISEVLIPDVGIVIPSAGGSDSFSEVKDLEVISGSDDIVTLATDDAFGVGSHTLILSDASGVIDAADVASFLASLIASTGPTTATAHVVDAVIATTGPGAGFVPEQRTLSDGTIQTFTYLADGFSIDTMTETRPGLSPVVYTAVYNNGVRTNWTT